MKSILPPGVHSEFSRNNLGCIGVGGRAGGVIPPLTTSGAAVPIAFCDVDFKGSKDIENNLRAEYAFLHAGQEVVFTNSQSNVTRWFTFADAERACGVNEGSSTDYLAKISEATGVCSLVDRIRQLTADEIISSFIISDEFMENLKFSEWLPKQMVHELLRGRMRNQYGIRDTLGRNVTVVVDETSK